MNARAALTGLLWIFANATALAQQVSPEPSAAAKCLTPNAAERGEPEYPFAQFKDGKTGRVKVALRFASSAERPDVEVLQREGDDKFVEAVKAHVNKFRVPCQAPGDAPVVLHFEFLFRPDSRQVHWAGPTEDDAGRQVAMGRCVAHLSGEKFPEYPVRSQRDQIQGRVLARLTFAAADRAPQAQVYATERAARLGRAVNSWVQGLRMPCFEGAPATSTWVFKFVLGADTYGFVPALDLERILPIIQGPQSSRPELDLANMACPFEVKFQYRQPFLPNRVGELGTSDPSRRPFLEWLQGAQLKLPEVSLDRVFADETTLVVPCLKINLKPT